MKTAAANAAPAPGAWEALAVPEGVTCCDVVSLDTGDEIATVWSDAESPEARLIAAAPELLGAARAALALLESWSDFVPELDILRAAIAKTEGRA